MGRTAYQYSNNRVINLVKSDISETKISHGPVGIKNYNFGIHGKLLILVFYYFVMITQKTWQLKITNISWVWWHTL